MDEFSACVDSAGLFDLKWSGLSYWNNKSEGDRRIMRKLATPTLWWMVNIEWIQKFNSSEASFLNPGISDHSPIIVKCGNKKPSGGKPFKFHNMWCGSILTEAPFWEVVEKAWAEEVWGNQLYVVVQKLKNVKKALFDWNFNSFGRVEFSLANIRGKLKTIQARLQSSWSHSC